MSAEARFKRVFMIYGAPSWSVSGLSEELEDPDEALAKVRDWIANGYPQVQMRVDWKPIDGAKPEVA